MKSIQNTESVPFMNCRLIMDEQAHVTPSGRRFVQMTPIFHPDCCASGSLSFACWQVWEDEPKTFAAARVAALDSARNVMEGFSRELNRQSNRLNRASV
jgi:hypothetical protein